MPMLWTALNDAKPKFGQIITWRGKSCQQTCIQIEFQDIFSTFPLRTNSKREFLGLRVKEPTRSKPCLCSTNDKLHVGGTGTSVKSQTWSFIESGVGFWLKENEKFLHSRPKTFCKYIYLMMIIWWLVLRDSSYTEINRHHWDRICCEKFCSWSRRVARASVNFISV